MNQIPLTEQVDLTKAAHPFICLVHIGIKLAGVLCYLFMRLITKSSINTFITVLLLNSFDFWFVKNVSGRYLVGLRWWNGDADSGEEGWVWEHDNFKRKRSSADSSVFWGGLIANTTFWFVLGLVKVMGISLFWGMLVVINFFMSFTNLWAYYQCNQKYKNHVEKVISGFQQFGRASLHFVNTVMGNENQEAPKV